MRLQPFTVSLAAIVIVFATCAVTNTVTADEPVLTVELRRQIVDDGVGGGFKTISETQTWPTAKTAILICDMWDSHTSANAVKRVNELSPHINALVTKARGEGITIIHAPSSCMDAYADHPARQRAVSEPIVATLPDQITDWCYKIPSEEAGEYPIDQSDGGADDTAQQRTAWQAKLREQGRDLDAPWQKQTGAIKIDGDKDFISDRGDEIWSILANHSIDNVMMVGVHLNMCVLGRPFGLRRLASNGKNVVLVRDLTDTMYNPAMKPFVDHFTGTGLIVRHIERFVCPSMTSDQIVGGRSFRFSNDTQFIGDTRSPSVNEPAKVGKP